VILRAGVAVLLLLPTAAFAQGTPPGPFGGLFGRTPERVGKEYRVFEIRTSSSGQYEESLFDDAVPLDSRAASGAIASVNVGGMYEQRTTRLNLRLRSSGTYQQYLQSPFNGGTSVETSATANFRVATRFGLDGSLTHLYTPYFQFYPSFPSWTPAGVLVPPSSPYVATVIASHTYEAVGSFTSYYSKHSSLSASFQRRETRFSHRPDADLSMYGMRGLWSRQLNRDFRLKLGYGREQIHQSALSDADFVHEFIDAGVDFEKPLSLSRRTTLGFTTQTSMIRRPGTGRQYRLDGRVMLNSWLSRTWLASINAARATEFMPGFIEPLFSDNVGFSLMGLFSRRLELIASATGGKGVFGTDASAFDNPRFTMANSTVQLNVAVTRHFGLYGQHAFYYFQIPAGSSPVAPLDQLSRHTIVVGITAWIPVFNQERGERDSR